VVVAATNGADSAWVGWRRLIALALVFLSFVVRMYHLDRMRLEFDEAFSVQAGFQDLPGLLRLLATAEPHPPFFYSLIHFWYPVFGTTEFALRFPTVAANVLTVAFVIRLARLLGWDDAGLVAAALLALNPYQVWYAQEVRMYAPVALFGVAAACFALQARQSCRIRDLVLYASFLILALYTHYFAIYLAILFGALVGLDLQLDRNARLSRRRWIVTEAAIAAAFVPWLVYASQVGLYYIRAKPDPAALVGMVGNSLAYYSVARSLDPALGARLALGFLGVAVVGLIASRWIGRPSPSWFRTAFLTGYLLFPLAAGFLISLFRSMYTPNYLMVSAPAFFLVLGVGVVALARILAPLAFVALIYLFGAQAFSLRNYFVDPAYNKSEVGDAMVYVEEHLRTGDGIILDGWGQTTQFWFYHSVRFGDRGSSYVFPLAGPGGGQKLPEALDQILARHNGLWFLDYGVVDADREHLVEDYLDTHAYPSLYRPVQRNRLLYFVTAPSTAPRVTTLEATCDGSIELENAQQFKRTARAGGAVPIDLQWKEAKPTDRHYVVSWRLRDAEGHVVSQRDQEPVSGWSPTNTWHPGDVVADHQGLLLPSTLTPGTYAISVLLYDRATGLACPFQRVGKEPTELLDVGTIQVSAGPPRLDLTQPAPAHVFAPDSGELHLVGYDLDPGPYAPDQTITPRLYWELAKPIDVNLTLDATVVDAIGTPLQTVRTPLGPADYPTSRWLAGRVLALDTALLVPPRVTSGTYRLRFELRTPDGASQVLPETVSFPVVARARQFGIPAIAHPTDARFDRSISLLGFDLAPMPGATVRSGQDVVVTLYWRDDVDRPESLKVFTHLVGLDGMIYGQDDSIPLAGAAPTDGWVPREVLTDRYDLAVAPTAPPGVYWVEVGFYDPASQTRLSLADGSDSLTIASLRVGPG
jgi:mannosyltransferase